MHDCQRFPCGGGEALSWAHADRGFSAARQTKAASCHGMRPRGRSARPLGRHSASRLHAHKIWRASECSAPWWAHRESAALAAWVATLVAAESAAPAAPQTQWRPDARSGAHSGARAQAQSGSNHEQSVALGRPTLSPHAVVLGEGAAAPTATGCLAMYRTRFWTTMEGWCSMQQMTSEEGDRPACTRSRWRPLLPSPNR